MFIKKHFLSYLFEMVNHNVCTHIIIQFLYQNKYVFEITEQKIIHCYTKHPVYLNK